MRWRALCVALLCPLAAWAGDAARDQTLYAISSWNGHGIHLTSKPDVRYNCPPQRDQLRLVLEGPPSIDLLQGESFRYEQIKVLARDKSGKISPEPLALTIETGEPLVAVRDGRELLALRPGAARMHARAMCPGRNTEVVIPINVKPVAGPYKAALVGDEGHTLMVVTADGELQAPITEKEQEGFGDAQISEDHSVVGWLAEISNCCTSYPLPLTLVLFKSGKVIHRIPGEMSIWAWGFANRGAAIAYRARLPHGTSVISYRLHSVSSGELIDKFDCDDLSKPGTYENSGPVPDWVWPIAEECPERN